MQKYTKKLVPQKKILPYQKMCVLLHPISTEEIMPWWWNGRHGRLKICCSQEREGSSPSRGTKRTDNQRVFYFYIKLIQNLYTFFKKTLTNLKPL